MITVRPRAAANRGWAFLLLIPLLALTQCGSDDPAAPPPPTVGLSASSVAFTGEEGGGDPQTSVVNVTHDGAEPLTGLAVQVVYASGKAGDWLTATLSSTTSPANLTITAQTGSLAVGTYAATVTVTTDTPGVEPGTIAVGFDVVEPGTLPAIELPTDAVSFVGTAGEANPLPQTVPVTAGGGGAPLTGLAARISYADGQPDGWLAATLDGSEAPTVLRLQVDIADLVAGTYDAVVAVTSLVASNSPQNLAVKLRMTTGTMPTIELSPTAVTFSAGVGGIDPTASLVAVDNGGGGSLTGLGVETTYAEGGPKGWLTAVLTAATAPTALLLQATVGTLPAGAYQATVSVTSDVATNSPQDVTVGFNVTSDAPQTIVLQTGTVSIIGSLGEPSLPQTLAVTNGADGSLTGLEADVIYAPGQLTGWLSAELAGTTAPTSLRIQAAFDGLVPGTYNATVVVSSPVAGNSPQELAVTLRLTSAGP